MSNPTTNPPDDLDHDRPSPAWAPSFEQFRAACEQDEAVIGMTRQEVEQSQ